ncbi:MAG: HEAT repeat domain-containing protein [Candidatus Hydrogenedens sp.]|nr:HEAT repeat domain-containing protein [Candidatus Hydrogenedentota bacterium]NLF57109.1 HEAT repeat domain-containing protein [Candidatus Hydrogenedens sp.]
MDIRDQRKIHIEQFLANLVAAQKRIQLYPANSPVIKEAMTRLAAGLGSLFAAVDGGLTLGIVRDQFFDDKTPVGSEHVPIRRFAASLYQTQVKLFSVSPEVTAAELRRFITLACLKPEDIQAGGGMAAQMAALRLEHVSVEEAAELQLIERDKTADEWDILDYIRNRSRAGRGEDGPDAGGARGGGGNGEGVTAEELADFFSTSTDGSLEKARCFRNTLGDPARLAEVLNSFAETRAVQGGGLDAETAQSLGQAFRQISATIAALPEPARGQCARNVAEAILGTRAPVRRQFLKQVLPSQVGQFRSVDLIIAALRDEAVGDILADHVMFHEGSRRTLGNFLADLSEDPRRAAMLQETLSSVLAVSEEGRIRQILESLEAGGPLPPPQFDDAPHAAPRPDAALPEATPQFEMISPSQMEYIRQELAEDCTLNAFSYAVSLALALQWREDFGDFAGNAVQLVARSLEESFGQNRFDLMRRVLDLAQDHEDRIPGLRDLSLARYLDQARLDALVDALRAYDPAAAEYGHIVGILRMSGDRAVLRLFQRLSDEADRARRIFLLEALVALGDAVTRAMGRNITNPKWFVVRNAVFVLGKVASESAVDMLAQVQGHAEPRVRLEVVRALGAIGGEKAEEAALGLLADEDLSVAEQAADCLSRFNPQRTLPRLRALLAEHRRVLTGRPHVADRIIAFFAENGEKEDLKLLGSLRPSRLRMFSRPSRHLAGQCRKSMRRIRQRAEKAVT